MLCTWKVEGGKRGLCGSSLGIHGYLRMCFLSLYHLPSAAFHSRPVLMSILPETRQSLFSSPLKSNYEYIPLPLCCECSLSPQRLDRSGQQIDGSSFANGKCRLETAGGWGNHAGFWKNWQGITAKDAARITPSKIHRVPSSCGKPCMPLPQPPQLACMHRGQSKSRGRVV